MLKEERENTMRALLHKVKDTNGDNLQIAIAFQSLDIDLDATMNYAPKGDTMLHLSIRGGYYKLATSLISLGADVNKCNEVYEYPIHLAVKNMQVNLVRDLINAGANYRVCDWNGNSIYYMAKESRHLAILNYLDSLL